MCKVNASTIRAAQTRERMKKSLLIRVLALQGKQQTAPYLQRFYPLEVIKKTLGNAIQTKLQFFTKNEKAPLLKDQNLVALSVSTQTL